MIRGYSKKLGVILASIIAAGTFAACGESEVSNVSSETDTGSVFENIEDAPTEISEASESAADEASDNVSAEENNNDNIEEALTLGDERFEEYIPLLEGKRVALFSNQSGIVGDECSFDYDSAGDGADLIHFGKDDQGNDVTYGEHVLDALIRQKVDVACVLPASKITYDTSGGRQRNDGAADEPEQDAAAVREPAETPEHTQGSSDGGDLYAELEKAGVDTAAGLKYCMNDRDFYRSLLIQFAAESDEKRTGMEKYFAEGDLKNYAILVHALKSTSRMIGCTGLSESAKALEQAAKDGDSAYISGHHAGVIVRYDSLTGLIRQVCGIAPDSGGEDEEESLEFEPENDSDGVLEFAPEDGE